MGVPTDIPAITVTADDEIPESTDNDLIIEDRLSSTLADGMYK